MTGFEAAFKAMLDDPRSAPARQTPSEVVYTENKLRLLHYRADEGRRTKDEGRVERSALNVERIDPQRSTFNVQPSTGHSSSSALEHSDVPLLIVPSVLYGYSILDLAPGASLVG